MTASHDPLSPTEPSARVGEVRGFDDRGAVRVVLATGEVAAQTVVPLTEGAIGASVAVVPLAGGDAPWLVVGRVQPPGPAAEDPLSAVLEVDGERATLSARKRITLSCGKASVELTRAGKILLRGTYIASESDGLQHLRAAVVEVN